MKRIILGLLMATMLTGCFGSNFTQSGVRTTLTATGAAVVGTVVAGPAGGVAAGVITGVVTDAVTEENTETTTEVLETLPEEERAGALKAQFFWEAIESLGMWAIGAVFAFFMLPLLIGYFIPTRRQRKLEKMAFNHPDITHESMK